MKNKQIKQEINFVMKIRATREAEMLQDTVGSIEARKLNMFLIAWFCKKCVHRFWFSHRIPLEITYSFSTSSFMNKIFFALLYFDCRFTFYR